ncbi:DNA-directed RNA polymerase III, subunit Rpc31 [Lophiotrema nucula]|uniref:DNA-directed RNA polymerase III subunit n=1 Tax=Lophiotrema nucula TaxID=690887 RepID=A0A6A5YXW1_9PLEO|nr:DNA-directed RNA polymerase III, subunit Rpc31 [Lophiotrema nucula]
MPPSRGGRGGARGGGFTAARPGTVKIAGVELQWDLSGLEIEKAPAERFPKRDPPMAPKPTPDEEAIVQHYLTVRDRIHEGPFYTVLNDGMTSGLKRKANEPAPTEAQMFNPFTDNQTYSSKYLKVRRRIPKLDTRPYVTELFPEELRSLLENKADADHPNKKRKLLSVAKGDIKTKIDRIFDDAEARLGEQNDEEEEEAEEAEEENEEDDKPDQVEEDDNWSAVSSDSEESDDDYNAEQYFDNGEDDDIDDADPYENTYD